MAVHKATTDRLYTPALYARFSERADIALLVSLQSELSIVDKKPCITVSSSLADAFGFKVDGFQVYLGVPHILWNRFTEIDWQSFIVVGCDLYLFYDVEEKVKTTVYKSHGKELVTDTRILTLSFQFPLRPSSAKSISLSTILHIWSMDADGVGDPTDSISITKSLTSNKGYL